MALLSRYARVPATICRSALLLLVLLAMCAGQTSPSTLNGKWQMELSFSSGLMTKLNVVLRQKGTDLSGEVTTATGNMPIKGTINGSDIEFTELIGKGYDAQFKGKQTGADALEGTMDAPPYGTGSWTAKR